MKLTYVKTSDLELTIDLQNGYSIIANGLYIKGENPKYEFDFYLLKNTDDILEQRVYIIAKEIVADYKSVYTEILKYTSALLSNGEIDEFIKYYNRVIDNV